VHKKPHPKIGWGFLLSIQNVQPVSNPVKHLPAKQATRKDWKYAAIMQQEIESD
jgi:hypothetical protein